MMNINLDPGGRFASSWPHVLIQECPHPDDWSNAANFSDDPRDPGGATMCGIIESEYEPWRSAHALVAQPVRHIALSEGQAIYWSQYWTPALLPPGLDLAVFDTRVNCGVGGATKILQRSLGIGADGAWGAQTEQAVAAITDVPAAIRAFSNQRLAYYRALALFPVFGADWTRRTQEIEAQSLAAAGEVSTMAISGRAGRDHTGKGYVAAPGGA